MQIIEPCCAKKHLLALREELGKSGTTLFECFGDMSMAELLPALMTRYSQTDMLIAAPALPDRAADAITHWMRKQWAQMDGKGKLDVISHLTLVADLSPEKSPSSSGWLQNNPFGERLTIVNRRQTQHVILLPDIAILNFANMQYGSHFIATATTKSSLVNDLWKIWRKVAASNQQAAGCL
ncbi:MAG: hypothetical protein J5732_03055 [Bacteroidaceae bacterium]|nr:hypothetical protein [Bacteroidaceae bacterium]